MTRGDGSEQEQNKRLFDAVAVILKSVKLLPQDVRTNSSWIEADRRKTDPFSVY